MASTCLGSDEMKKEIHKYFPVYRIEALETWLCDMANQGWKLVEEHFWYWTFEPCEKGAYRYRVDFKNSGFDTEAGQRYISFLEECGAECITIGSFLIACVKAEDASAFELYSDRSSWIALYTRLMRYIWLYELPVIPIGVRVVLILTSAISGNETVLQNNLISLIICGIFLVVMLAIVLPTYCKLYKKRKRLQQERVLFE